MDDWPQVHLQRKRQIDEDRAGGMALDICHDLPLEPTVFHPGTSTGNTTEDPEGFIPEKGFGFGTGSHRPGPPSNLG
jgi:hypothetical protein